MPVFSFFLREGCDSKAIPPLVICRLHVFLCCNLFSVLCVFAEINVYLFYCQPMSRCFFFIFIFLNRFSSVFSQHVNESKTLHLYIFIYINIFFSLSMSVLQSQKLISQIFICFSLWNKPKVSHSNINHREVSLAL